MSAPKIDSVSGFGTFVPSIIFGYPPTLQLSANVSTGPVTIKESPTTGLGCGDQFTLENGAIYVNYSGPALVCITMSFLEKVNGTTGRKIMSLCTVDDNFQKKGIVGHFMKHNQADVDDIREVIPHYLHAGMSLAPSFESGSDCSITSGSTVILISLPTKPIVAR